jgi:hypothetical protein
MVWRPFATKPERVDTMEALDLLMLAPPLYSVFTPGPRTPLASVGSFA